MAKKYRDTYLETTDPKYARKMSKRVGKNTSIKTMFQVNSIIQKIQVLY